MKKLLATTLLLCLLTPAFASSFHDNDAKRIEYRYSIMFARSEAHRIGMEAVLDYSGESTTNELQDSYDEFVGYYDELESAKNAVDFTALWSHAIK